MQADLPGIGRTPQATKSETVTEEKMTFKLPSTDKTVSKDDAKRSTVDNATNPPADKTASMEDAKRPPAEKIAPTNSATKPPADKTASKEDANQTSLVGNTDDKKTVLPVDFTSLDGIMAYLTAVVTQLSQLSGRLPTSAKEKQEMLDLLKHFDQHLGTIHQQYLQILSLSREDLQLVIEGQSIDYALRLVETVATTRQSVENHFQSIMASTTAADTTHLTQEEHETAIRAALDKQQSTLTEQWEQELNQRMEDAKRHWRRDLKRLVDRERQGRLAQLDRLALQLKQLDGRLSRTTEHLVQSWRLQDQWNAFHRLLAVIETPGSVQQSIHEAWYQLRQLCKRDAFLTLVLESVSDQHLNKGVVPMAELCQQFEHVCSLYTKYTDYAVI
jgi:hypothetical protein